MQGQQQNNPYTNLKSESVWFKAKLVSQFFLLNFLLVQPFYIPYLHAAPTGGDVVGGTGTISQADLTTTINQTSQNLAIDWQSFDVNVDERVQFIQPNTSSIALNRILGNNGSTIQGQINANGQVILVNPNGIFFTSTATINVAGLVASSLDMTPTDFLNGNYIFNEVIGAEGSVINSGLINASLGGLSTGGDIQSGGNVALIGKQVKNEGLISANLGSVVLAAGKQSILTFDANGLIGVKVTKEVLQEEVGLDEAVVNSGDINASGGRVLLTASTSQDIFSQAVNNSSLDQATSVVVNDDGSFTLGGGADVLNTGSIDVSVNDATEANVENTARIVLLGENITSSGSIKADSLKGDAGEIELHAKDKTLLTENSITSAQALASGQGGLIKILGDKVGLFDTAQVNASGVNGGGEVLIGGDRQGLNTSIRNASFIYLGENTTVKADATDSGNGGKVITFAEDTARIHGDLFARGGLNGGDGGFIETSGLRGFEITNTPDLSAVNGEGGLWLIDPYNITIVNTTDCGTVYTCTSLSAPFSPAADNTYLDVARIESALSNSNVEVNTGSSGTQDGDITFQADLNFNINGNNSTKTLTLDADNDITFTTASSITSATNDNLNLVLTAGRNVTLSSDTVNGSGLNGINLKSGYLNITSGGTVSFNSGTIDTDGGNINILESNAVDFNGATVLTGVGDFDITNNTANVTSTSASSITTTTGDFTVSAAVNFDSSNATINVGTGKLDLDGVTNNVTLGEASGKDLRVTDVNSVSQFANTSLVFQDARFKATATTDSVVLLNTGNDFDSIRLESPIAKIYDLDGIELDDGTNITNTLDLTAGGNITDGGTISIHNNAAGTDAEAIFNTTGNVTFSDSDNNFDKVNLYNASTVNIKDNSGGISIAANNETNTAVTGNLTIKAVGGDIISYGEMNVSSSSANIAGFTVDNGRSIDLSNDSNNTFKGKVDFFAQSGSINDISIVDDTTLQLRLINIAGDLNVTASSITQNTSGVTVVGDTTLSSSGNITLADNDNNFNNLTISNGESVSIFDSTAIRLLSSNTNNDLSISATNDISLVGNVTTNNNASTESADVTFTGDVLLDTAINGGTVTIDTSDSDGNVYFSGTIDNVDVVTPKNNLAIKTNNGDVTVVGNIGGESIGSLLINKNVSTTTSTVSLNQIKTRETSTLNTASAVDITANTINLSGDIETDIGTEGHARGVTLNGDVTLESDILIDTSSSDYSGVSDGNIVVTGNILTDGTERDLVIVSDTGTVSLENIGSSSNALSLLSINNGASDAAGTVDVGSIVTRGGENGGVKITGQSITLNGNVDSTNNGSGTGGSAGDIILNGPVILANDITITSNGTGSYGNVSINNLETLAGNINSDSTAARTLTINANDENITVQGDIGNLNSLQKVAFDTTGIVSVNNITTVDSLINANDSGVSLKGATINLGGDITSNTITGAGTDAGVINIDGAVVLLNDVSVNTDQAGSTNDGSVTFTSSIQADDVVNGRVLNVQSGDSDISIAGNIGTADALQKVDLITSGITGTQIDVGAITTTDTTSATGDSGIVITAENINLSGDITTNDINGSGTEAGSVDINGAVVMQSDVAVLTDLSSSSNDGLVDFSGSIQSDGVANGRVLVVASGDSSVNIGGDIGTTQALQRVDIITSKTAGTQIDVNAITTTDATGSSDDSGVSLVAESINLVGYITSNTTNGSGNEAGSINIDGDATLANNVFINTDLAASSSDGAVYFTGSIQADDVVDGRVLNIQSGNESVYVGGDIGTGANQALQKVDITTSGASGTWIYVNEITTTDTTNTTDDSGVALTAETIYLSDNITSNTISGAGTQSGSVTVTGDAVLSTNVTVDTFLAGTTTGGDVIFSSIIDTDDATNNYNFSIDAGDAIATVGGIVGGNQAVNGFTVTSAGTTNINEVNTQTDGIDITSGIINLNGNLNTKTLDDAGHITLVGAVNLNSDTTFDTEGATSDAAIYIDGSVNNATSRILVLNAGLADVTMTGTAGSGIALASLSVNGDNVDLGLVNSIGNIDVTGDTSIDLSGDLSSNSGLIDLQNGAVTLNDNVTLTVAGTNTVTVDGTINANSAANDYSFTVNAGSGNVTLSGDIGLSEAVQGLSITTGGAASIQSVDTRSGGVVVTSDTLNLNGSIDTTDNLAAAGIVTLEQDTLNLQTNTVINTNSVDGTDNNISIKDTLVGTTDVNDNSLVLDAGTGTVNVNTELTNLSSFSVASSLSSSLNGISTNDGQITVNADKDIVLSGIYSSGTADMSFNADTDLNNVGLLNLTNTSSFTGTNISFSAASLTADAISVTANNTVSFNNTRSRIILGDNYGTSTYNLSNSFLDKIDATTLQVRADNSYIMLNGTITTDNDYLLDLDARIIYSYTADSELNNIDATATSLIRLFKDISVTNNILLSAPDISSYNYDATVTNVTSNTGSIEITGNISGPYQFNLNAADTVTLQGDTTVSLTRDLNINANLINHGNVIASRNINLVSGSAYTQPGNIESTSGNISITATTGNIGLDYNKTNLGSITVNAIDGNIFDNNSDATNIETSGQIVLTATGGIGHNNPLEIITHGTNASLSATNSGTGDIEIINTGDITLYDITNNAGDSAFNFTGVSGDVIIRKVTLDTDIDSILAVASFDVNGNVYGDYTNMSTNPVHLTANSATFDLYGVGRIGNRELEQPLVVDVRYSLSDVGTTNTYIDYYLNRSPEIYSGANVFKNKALQAIENISGQQLIEVEALADVDAAIFTDVRNYSHSDVALMMPADQRYTEDEEEDEEEKSKRQNFLNSNP